MFSSKRQLRKDKTNELLIEILRTQMTQAKIINANRITVDNKLWEIQQLIEPSAAIVENEQLRARNNLLEVAYEELESQYVTLSKAHTAAMGIINK